MAPSAVSEAAGTPSELPDEVNKPPEGVILPPKDIKVIVEKTAGFVARNGHVFEDRVREKEKNNTKFCFLNPHDAYAPFYAWRLSEIKAGRGTDVSAGRAGEAAPVKKEEETNAPKPPPEFQFSARMPNINALDLEVVKLTALFVAKRGKSFMTSLSQRETRNFQFDFLRPQHSLYQFFTRLVDQYRELLQVEGRESAVTEEQRRADLRENVKNKYNVLGRAKQRAEWVKYQEMQKLQKEEEEEEEKVAYAQIDWHDFVVVETVLFTEADDQTELPPPTSLNDLQTASLEQKAMMSLQPHDRRIEEAMPTEDDSTTYYNATTDTVHQPSLPILQPQRPISTGPIQPPAQSPSPFPSTAVTSASLSPAPMPATASPTPSAAAIPDQLPARDRMRAAPSPSPLPGQPPMRIRSDYVPRAQAKHLSNANQPTSICPNCRQQIPIAEMEQHMRIELQDPRWKEQRAKAEARFASTNLSTADVANNLKRLASQRSDVFDPVLSGGAAASGQAEAEDEEIRRKRVAVGPNGVPVKLSAPVPQHQQQSYSQPHALPAHPQAHARAHAHAHSHAHSHAHTHTHAPGTVPGMPPGAPGTMPLAPGVGPPGVGIPRPSSKPPTMRELPQPPIQKPPPVQSQTPEEKPDTPPVNINEQIRKIHEKMKQ
ncbi:splicing factor 3 subunit 1 [Nannizzia gypsea CBS 118893]|uniref:Splicing factor 3 subunit 1 n=1 Tax=Arthroderma gypseum (strain ATCC MYA-4604 / CBS 118893) TaxID=535722 RepID=E4UWL1_ARTGP|nr:splicing factor 3 subunit 1 [Nannizzia gypsea CBS 118893]EFR02554.1 splicing factor 3 subunit 1 [Nannizzia gypsea CBS 118893]